MPGPDRNRLPASDLTNGDVEAALARIHARDAELARDARHVYDTLTWGDGPGQLRLSGLQEWLWYRLATKYMTDEPGYMTRLAATAAELFDELGLEGYAAVCRSDTTAQVHAAYATSDADGIAAMRKAASASGIDPPDLADFVWGDVMAMEESMARSAAGDALERAIATGDLTPGGRGWRGRQQEVTRAALDAEHPDQPGQTWRTAITTERIGAWVDQGERRSPRLGRVRAGVANRLLHPVRPPGDVAERLAPLTWTLDLVGDEQSLTQSGYLNTDFVRRFHVEKPWDDRFPLRTPPRSEADDMTLSRLRGLLESMGAVRKRGRTLKRTKKGGEMAVDPHRAWTAAAGAFGRDPWDRFVVQTSALLLLDAGGRASGQTMRVEVATIAAEMGWQTSGDDGGHQTPSEYDVAWAFSDTQALLELFGMLAVTGDWADRRLELAPSGEATMAALLRATATAPREHP
ncbi:hypothetical protein BH24ACT4_BH24ACT4_07130 [soil metagenome]